MSGLFVDNVLWNLPTRTPQATDQSEDKDSEGDVVKDLKAGGYLDHTSDDMLYWSICQL